MAHYLVTGGAGFIGSNIAIALVEQGHSVRVLDNYSTGSRGNLCEIESDIEIVEGDVRSLLTVEKAVKGIDYVLHQAALPSVPRSIADPGTTNEVNVTGTLNILNAAKEAGVTRVVIASSSSVYGDTPVMPKHEAMNPNPKSPYAVSKLACEHYAKVFHQLYGLEAVVLRYFNIFGRHQDPDSQYSAVIPKFCKALLRSESPVIFGDGTQTRDFTHVQNVVHANLLACTSARVAGKIMNIAGGRQISLNELFRRLKAILGSSVDATYKPARKGDVHDSYADIHEAKESLGYSVVVDFESGLQQTAEFFQSRL